MFLYALRRLLLAIPLLIGITFISFLVIHLAPGTPGEIQTGDLSVRSPAVNSTTSPLATPRRSAVRGLSVAALSQVSLEKGRGSSCSHPLFANRPS